MASDIVPVKRMGEGMGYFGLSTSLAMSMGPIIGVTLLQGAGFVTLMLCTAGVLAVIYPLSYSLTRKKAVRTDNSENIMPQATTSASESNPKQKTPFNRKLILPSVLNCLLSITYGGLVGFIVLYGKEANLANPALFFLFNALAVLLVRPFAGRIYDNKGPKALLIPGAICCCRPHSALVCNLHVRLVHCCLCLRDQLWFHAVVSADLDDSSCISYSAGYG
ncbi:MFS transporter [Paenibacillus amylolyticus]|nr:MFS transporter [Paenibacillus amylolyticus]